MTIEQRRAYCLHDAHLVAELVKINNGDILRLMEIIAHNTGLDLHEVCEKGMTGIWTKIINKAIHKKIDLVGYGNLPFALRSLYSTSQHHSIFDYRQVGEDIDGETDDPYDYDEGCLHKGEKNNQLDGSNLLSKFCFTERASIEVSRKYKGATVLEPNKGIHHDVYVFDVTSLYPTIIIKYNLSPETVNCPCCRNDSKASGHITSEILEGCQHIPKEGRYWICQKKRGLFARILEEQRV